MGCFLPAAWSQEPASGMFGDAEAYERFMGRWSRLVAPPFVDFAALPEQGLALDIGSGTGSLAFAIAGRKKHMGVTGIDPAKEYVAYAASRNPFPKRASFEVGDGQALRFPDASFDAALSLLVFNFIPDAKTALREARRVTRAGGAISAAVWDYGDGMRMLRTFWDAVVQVDPRAESLDEKHMPLCRAGQLSRLWKEGGLEDVREEPIKITMSFMSFADYWEPFLLGQGPAGACLHHLDGEKQQAVRAEARRRLKLERENAPFSLPARVWAVRGVVPRRP